MRVQERKATEKKNAQRESRLAKIEHIIPILQYRPFKFFNRRKPDFQHAWRTALLKEMDVKMPKGEHEVTEDPFLVLGYGVNAYF